MMPGGVGALDDSIGETRPDSRRALDEHREEISKRRSEETVRTGAGGTAQAGSSTDNKNPELLRREKASENV